MRCMLVVGTEVGILTNCQPTLRKIPKSQNLTITQRKNLKSHGDPGSKEVSIISDKLCVIRNYIIYIDTILWKNIRYRSVSLSHFLCVLFRPYRIFHWTLQVEVASLNTHPKIMDFQCLHNCSSSPLDCLLKVGDTCKWTNSSFD